MTLMCNDIKQIVNKTNPEDLLSLFAKKNIKEEDIESMLNYMIIENISEKLKITLLYVESEFLLIDYLDILLNTALYATPENFNFVFETLDIVVTKKIIEEIFEGIFESKEKEFNKNYEKFISKYFRKLGWEQVEYIIDKLIDIEAKNKNQAKYKNILINKIIKNQKYNQFVNEIFDEDYIKKGFQKIQSESLKYKISEF